MREAGMQPEMIGFRIGWDWGHARVLDKHSQVMLEMAQLHEAEKMAMARTFNAHLGMIRQQRRIFERNFPAFMIGCFASGLIAGFWIG